MRTKKELTSMLQAIELMLDGFMNHTIKSTATKRKLMTQRELLKFILDEKEVKDNGNNKRNNQSSQEE